MRWVWPGSIASVSSQNGFQPSSSRSSRRKWWPCRWKTVAISARLVSASTTMRPALARKAGCGEAAKVCNHGPLAARSSARSTRSAFFRSSRAGSPLDGNGGGGGSGAARAGGSRDTMMQPSGPGLLAFVQEDLEVRARRRGHIDKGVDPAARRQHQRAVAGREMARPAGCRSP